MATHESTPTTTTTTTIKGLPALGWLLAAVAGGTVEDDVLVVPAAVLENIEVTATGRAGEPVGEYSLIDEEYRLDVRAARRITVTHRGTGATVKVAPVRVGGRWSPFRQVVATNPTRRMAAAIHQYRDASAELAEAEAAAEADRRAPGTFKAFDGLGDAVAAFQRRR